MTWQSRRRIGECPEEGLVRETRSGSGRESVPSHIDWRELDLGRGGDFALTCFNGGGPRWRSSLWGNDEIR